MGDFDINELYAVMKLSDPWDVTINQEPIFQSHALTGKLLSFNQQIDNAILETIPKERIKAMIAEGLVKEMLDKGLIEFTKRLDPITNTTVISAYCYVTPNDQTRLVRTLLKEK